MWQVRCTVGFQPPDMARQSVRSFSMPDVGGDADRLKPLAAMGVTDLRALVEGDIQIGGGIRAAVDQGGDMHACRDQIGGGAMGVVVVAEDGDGLARG